VLASTLSRRISQPILDLADQAEALGHGQVIEESGNTGLREVDNVRRALISAGTEIREREDALLAADRAKDEFLAMLGHELRNPLSALSSAAQVLQLAGAKEGPSSHAAGVIGRQVKHMTRLVDDLLDVSRAITGKVNLSLRTLNLAEITSNAVGVLRSSGRLEEHVVQINAVPVWIYADEARIEQIVLNLVGNALKFTPPGGAITITVTAEGGQAVLQVCDTGIGMPADLVPRVFDLFVQGERKLDRGPGGLGIGLTLVRRLAELHGGSAAVTSDGPGCGAVFTVSLPMTAAPARALSAVTPVAVEPSDVRILLIEDNEDARLSLLSALTLYGYEVYQSSDGLTGIENAVSLQPDVAVVDIGLPGADGFAVAGAVRARCRKPDLLLIALSGYGQPESRQRAFAAGFDDYLTKPVTPAALARLIESRLSLRRKDSQQMRGK
jgi:signal transduction histidine kinase/CheY-like chemotaxis protein